MKAKDLINRNNLTAALLMLMSVFMLGSCGAVDEAASNSVLSDISVNDKTDFDQLELDLDEDGAADLFGKLYREPNDTSGILQLYGMLFTSNGWHLLSKQEDKPSNDLACSVIWPLYKGDSICCNNKESEDKVGFYKGKEALAFVAKAKHNKREELLATGNLASGREQFVALMKIENGRKRYAWVDISINPVLKLQWEDKDRKEMGYNYYCETNIRKRHFETNEKAHIFAGLK